MGAGGRRRHVLAAGLWATSGEGEGRVRAILPGWVHMSAKSLRR